MIRMLSNLEGGRILFTELVKLRRSKMSVLLLGPPMLVVLLVVGVSLQRQNLADWDATGIIQLRLTVNAVWCYFMLPLVTALMAAIVFSYEHRNQTWGFMRVMPVSMGKVYLCKLALVWSAAMLATIMLYSFLALAIHAISSSGSLHVRVDYSYFIFNLCILSGASIPFVALQSFAALSFRSIIVPLVISILATLLVAPIGSTRFWPYFPWSYPLVALNASSEVVRAHALICGLLLGTIVVAGGFVCVQKCLLKSIES